MKIIRLLSSFCLITVMLTSAGALAASESSDPSISKTYDGTYLVKLNSVTTAPNGVIEKLGGKLKKISESGDIVVAELSGSSLYELKNSPDIQYIEPNYEVETEIEAEKTDSVTETVPYGIQNIHAIEAQQEGYTGKGVKIAVLDSGYSQHSDVNVKSGYSFITNSENYDDDFGHGTHVAGIIAASINGEGVVGVAPKADIYAIKVLDQGGRAPISPLSRELIGPLSIKWILLISALVVRIHRKFWRKNSKRRMMQVSLLLQLLVTMGIWVMTQSCIRQGTLRQLQ
ncbi:S8 family serine peptidase [Paenibacillus sonchi]|uniref:S8 family serine peptidase n=1 Tax=Paenibacillus sonchi TaxID=373687 RepID=A0A974PEU3_9BACL|nr:S8 family serine peptidase [Paenibacillus sonchi]